MNDLPDLPNWTVYVAFGAVLLALVFFLAMAALLIKDKWKNRR